MTIAERLDTELGTLILLGENATPVWGMSNAERIRRLAQKAAQGGAKLPADKALFVNLAYAFDPILIGIALRNSDTAITRGGAFILGQLPATLTPDVVMQTSGLATMPIEDGDRLYNEQLRKLETPFITPLRPDTRAAIERQSYQGAYKGVTDVLTKYLWPELALWLTRFAAAIGMSPNMVTAIGGTLCLLATWFFWQGQFWTGIACGFGFMILDTVDGKLARCTITSSKWGNVFDHGIDLVHPPFWWYAWGIGLAHHGLALSTGAFAVVMAAIVIGYVAQRLIEGVFIKYLGLEIHIWQRFDSRFRLITARRNPNMVILIVALLLGRPDLGLIAIAWWTILSLGVHAIRLLQALAARRRSQGPLTSWMTEAA